MKKAIPANISKILVYFCIALLVSVAASAVFLNRARLYSADGQQMNAEHIVSDYVKRMGKMRNVEFLLNRNFPSDFLLDLKNCGIRIKWYGIILGVVLLVAMILRAF